MTPHYFPPGTTVHIGNDISPIVANIIGVLLTYDHVRYHVSYWDSCIYRTEWMEAFEVREAEPLATSKTTKKGENP